MFFQVLGTSWLLVVPQGPAVFCNNLTSAVAQSNRLPERFVTKLGICWIRFVKGHTVGLTITALNLHLKEALSCPHRSIKAMPAGRLFGGVAWRYGINCLFGRINWTRVLWLRRLFWRLHAAPKLCFGHYMGMISHKNISARHTT